jgi:hypothetical protein
MPIPVEIKNKRVDLDLSEFIPALSKEEILDIFDDMLPLLKALLDAQLAWASTTDEKRQQLVQAHLSLGMMTQAAISSAIYRANMQKDVTWERTSIDNLGFPEFGSGPEIDD